MAPERAGAGWLWRAAFAHRYLLPRATLRHTVESNLDALRRIGLWPEDADKALVLVPGAAAEARAGRCCARTGSRAAASSSCTRLALAVQVLAGRRRPRRCSTASPREGWPLVLTGAPDPAEQALVAAIRAATRAPAIDLSGQLSLLRARAR